MVVSDTVSYADIYAVLEYVSAVLGRQVNPTILTTEDLAADFEKQSAFTVRVWSQPKVWVIGGEDDVGARQPEHSGKPLKPEPPDAVGSRGFRSANRYIVFQLLPHTLGLGPRSGG